MATIGPATGGEPVSVSIGVANAPGDGSTFVDLLSTADKRLYAAKRFGRNTVVCDDRDRGDNPVGLIRQS